MSPEARQALEQFQQAGSWEQRARLLMQWGDRLEPLAPDERCESNRIHGCESRVWLVADRTGLRLHFRASSEARLLRGLLALLLLRVNTEPAATLDLHAWFGQLGLGRQLSPSRGNGLNALLQQIRHLQASTC